METFILYIVKAAICLGIFLSIYAVFLRNTTFLRFNRFFLVFGFVASLLLASFTPTYDVVISIPVVVAESAEGVTNEIVSGVAYNVWHILGYIYLAGLVFVLIRNIFSYLKIYRLIRKGVKTSNKDFVLVENSSVTSPFSVLKYILLNSSRLSEVEKDLILQHEITHIKQRHWIDLLCSECMLLLQWFNPLVWIYVRLLKENHEFLADRAVLDSGASATVYRAVLVNQEFQGPIFSFSNSFNYSKSLNRLSMMKKEKSASWKRLTALAIVPMFGLFLWASAEPNYILKKSGAVEDESSIFSDTIKSKVPLRGTMVNIKIKKEGDKSSIDMTETSAEELGKALIIVDGVKGVKLETVNPENIANVSVLKDKSAIEKYGEEGKNGVILITTKASKAEGAEGKIVVRGSGESVSDLSKVLVLVDRVKAESVDDIEPEDIESMNVLKGEVAIKEYGEEGKNGVVLITTKDTDNNETNELTIVESSEHYNMSSFLNKKAPKDALILVDGKKVSSTDDVKPEDIESISVLKDKAATDTYGEEGKNGVVIIEMKKN